MIKCYKDGKDKNGVIVELDGDPIEVTTDFTCIASRLLRIGVPMQILKRSLDAAEKYKAEWKVDETD